MKVNGWMATEMELESEPSVMELSRFGFNYYRFPELVALVLGRSMGGQSISDAFGALPMSRCSLRSNSSCEGSKKVKSIDINSKD